MEDRVDRCLTMREEEILRLVIRGLNTVEIARELMISPNTVRTHLASMFVKCGVRSRTELIAWWIDLRRLQFV